MRFRFTIAKLLGAVAFLGVGLAALRSPTQLWAGTCLALALGSLTIAVLTACYRSGQKRAFWIGFSACGWMYLILHLAPWFDTHVGPHLATTGALDFLYDQLEPDSSRSATYPLYSYSELGGNKSLIGPGGSDPSSVWLEEEWNKHTYLQLDQALVISPVRYRRIGHSLFALLAACAGGLVTRRISAS